MSENLKFEILEDGKILRVSAENHEDFLAFLKEHEDDALDSFQPNSDMAFRELTESYWCNGWGVYTADELEQMSECLVICEDSTIDDDGNPVLNGRSWTNIHNYQIVNPIEQIKEFGYIDFLIWE